MKYLYLFAGKFSHWNKDRNLGWMDLKNLSWPAWNNVRKVLCYVKVQYI